MKKKGFTLIELLAVIVILAIIALIATPLVLKYIEKSRQESKVDSAYSFVRNLETEIANYSIKHNGKKYNKSGLVEIGDLTDIDTTLKGDKPNTIKVCLSSLGQVEKAMFEYGKYYVSYDGKKGSISDEATYSSFSCSGNSDGTDSGNNDSNSSQYGDAIQTWDISETPGVDDVWMTYYQPKTTSSINDSSTAKENKNTIKQYEDGTIYITGKGKMQDYIYTYFVSSEGIGQQVANFVKEKIGYNVRYEIIDYDNFGYDTQEKIKLYIDDEAAGENNGKETSFPEEWVFDVTDKNAYKFIPTAIVVDEGVTNISSTSFAVTHITNITLPTTIKTIESHGFLMCEKLTTVNIPEGLETIELYAFGDCPSLKEIVIPESVISIDEKAFYNSGLTTIKGKSGSYAETWAKSNGYTFIGI